MFICQGLKGIGINCYYYYKWRDPKRFGYCGQETEAALFGGKPGGICVRKIRRVYKIRQ